MAGNIYFDLTREFNREQPTVLLASGQAVVFHRVAIMSKDGDWVIRETAPACTTVLEILARHGAFYRPGAPLDSRWLAAGWSSHFEFVDERRRRVRCDFFSRPPRLGCAAVAAAFARTDEPLAVVDIESLIVMKQTQRAKDYAVIGELATRLPPHREIEFSTDPDRLMALAPLHGRGHVRPAVAAACAGVRDAVVIALAREQDARQRRDRVRMDAFSSAAAGYLRAFTQVAAGERRLPAGHAVVCALANQLLPTTVPMPETADVDVE